MGTPSSLAGRHYLTPWIHEATLRTGSLAFLLQRRPARSAYISGPRYVNARNPRLDFCGYTSTDKPFLTVSLSGTPGALHPHS